MSTFGTADTGRGEGPKNVRKKMEEGARQLKNTGKAIARNPRVQALGAAGKKHAQNLFAAIGLGKKHEQPQQPKRPAWRGGKRRRKSRRKKRRTKRRRKSRRKKRRTKRRRKSRRKRRR